MFTVDKILDTKNYNRTCREPRQGIMLHDDGSSTDEGSMSWFVHPDNKGANYNYLILRDGRQIALAPHSSRAWHAGKCRPSETRRISYGDANSAFYGVAAAAGKGEGLTDEQYYSLIAICVKIFEAEGWDKDETWRITGHKDEAWPRGRKVDPYNFSVQDIRSKVANAS